MAVSILRLNVDDNPRIIVKQDNPTTIITGCTVTLIGSGNTQVNNISGDTWVIYSSGGTSSGGTVTLIPSGGTAVNNISGNTWVVYSPTGGTGGGITALVGSGGTWAGLLSGTTWTVYSPDYSGLVIDVFNLENAFTGHTGQTGSDSIHFTGHTFTQSGITVITQVGDNINIYVPPDAVTGVTWNGVTNKPAWITGGTAAEFASGHTHPQYLTGFTVTCDMVTGCTDGLYVHNDTFDGYTGQTYNDITGLTSSFTSHTGDTTIHTTMAQVNAALSGYTLTGTTAALQASLNDFSGDTYTQYIDLKEPSGFISPSDITVSYSYSARTITLTGTLDYYWRGVKKTLASPWTSIPHAASADSWYLSTTDGTNFTWSNSVWNFYDMQVAYGKYTTSSGTTFFGREVHGCMDWRVHEELHYNLGAYRVSGMQAIGTSYTANTASDSAVSPSFAQGVIQDEDCPTTIAQWLKTAGYTVMRVSGGTSVYTMANTVPFLALAANNYIYVNNPTSGALTAGIANRFYNVYQILVPVTSDIPSQKFRMVMLLPQQTYTTLAAAQAEDTRGLLLGDLSAASPELVIYGRITYSTSNSYNNYGKCVIPTNGITYVVSNQGSAINIGGVSATNHANLSNLLWDDSGHVSAADYLAAFNGSGEAVAIPKATFSASGHTHSQYALQSNINTYTGTTAPAAFASKSSIQTYTGTTAPATYKNLFQPRTTINANYTALAADNDKVLIWSDNNTYTVTLPSSGLTIGTHYLFFKQGGTGSVSFAAGAGSTIWGNCPAIQAGDFIELYYQSAGQWYCIRKNKPAWDKIQSRPAWLTGTTLSDFQNAHTHPQYLTGDTTVLVGSGACEVNNISGSTWVVYAPTGGTGGSAWSDITGKPAWLSGTTLGAFEAQHSHSTLYPTKTQIQTYTGTTAPATYAPLLASIKQVTGTSYTILSGDTGKIIQFTATGATTITIPSGSTFSEGFQCTLVSYGNGTTSGTKTLAAQSGATVKSANSALKLATIFGAATVYKTPTAATWVAFGDLTA
jgi:hypothetical protein